MVARSSSRDQLPFSPKPSAPSRGVTRLGGIRRGERRAAESAVAGTDAQLDPEEIVEGHDAHRVGTEPSSRGVERSSIRVYQSRAPTVRADRPAQLEPTLEGRWPRCWTSRRPAEDGTV